MTSTSITVGQVDDISAPIPGLFRSAKDGTQAYFDYINSQGGVYGRQLKLNAVDSAFSPIVVKSATQSQANNDFALVGGVSLLDTIENPIITASGIPDVTNAFNTDLLENQYLYNPVPGGSNISATGPAIWFKQNFPNDVKHVGILYFSDTPTEVAIQKAIDAMLTSLGYDIVYSHGVSVTQTSYLPDVLAMKSAGVQMVWESEFPTQQAVTLAHELAQEQMKVINVEGAAYAANLPALAGSAGNGMYIAQTSSLYQGEDANVVPSVALFDKWVLQVNPNEFSSSQPGFAPTGWAAAQLFVQALKAAGPNPTRAELIAQLNKITSFSADGLIATTDPPHNTISGCWLLAQVNNGKITRISPTPTSDYVCSPGGSYTAPGFQAPSR